MIDVTLLQNLYRVRDNIKAWKAKIRDDFSFDEMVKGVQEGFGLGFKHPELATLFEKAKKILIWTMQAINLIKKYENDFKPKLLNETYTNDLSVIINKNLISFEDDYRQVVFLTTEKPSESFQSFELEKLLQLKTKSDAWSSRVKEALQKKDYNPDLIQGLLEESGKFPTEM